MPSPGLNRVEIKGRGTNPGAISVTVDGHLMACDHAELTVRHDSLPVLEVTLPVIDDMVVSLDARFALAHETREALIAAGWAPPVEPQL